MDLTRFLVADDGQEPATRIEESTGDLGRVVKANVSTERAGCLMIRERPILVWKAEKFSDELTDYFDQFLALTEEDKALVLDMCTPPVNSDMMRKAGVTASIYQERYQSRLDHGMLQKLIGIANTNAHEYCGGAEAEYSEVFLPLGATRSGSGKAALFVYGSKVEHSW